MDRVPLPHRELFASPEVSMGPHTETKVAGNTESEILFLRSSCNHRHCSKRKRWKLAWSRHDQRTGCFLLSPGPVSPLYLTKGDKATSLYLLQSDFWHAILNERVRER